MPQRLARATLIDLSQCDREPIHAPGAVQSFGGLVVFGTDDAGGLTVTHASANVEAFLGRPATAILGGPVESVGPSDLAARITAAARDLDRDGIVPLGGFELSGERRSEATLIRRGGRLMLEVEYGQNHPATMGPGGFAPAHPETVWDVARDAAQRVRRLSGYDRVMIYRFHPDWSGEVIAEARDAGLVPYLGLRYPASDIPVQARALYLANRIRVLGDANAAPVALLAAPGAEPALAVDIGTAQVRAMSPVHLQYLRNMGVAATMVASLVVDGRLWGLVACHHRSPRVPSVLARAAALDVADALSHRIAALEAAETAESVDRAVGRIGRIAEAVRTATDPAAALLFGPAAIAAALGADGCALVCGDTVAATGLAPPASWCRAAARELLARPDGMFATDGAGGPTLAAGRPGHGVCGIAAVVLRQDPPVVAIAFSGEVVETVRWGGDPAKPVEVDGLGDRLTPRRSFAEWKETVVGRSRPRTGAEAQVLPRLRGVVASAADARRIGEAATALLSRTADAGTIDAALLDAASEGLGMVVGHGSDGRVEIVRMNRLLRDFMPDPIGPEVERTRTRLLRTLGVDLRVLTGEAVPAVSEVEAVSTTAGPRILRVSFRRLLEIDTPGMRQRLLAVACLDITEFRRFEEALQVATTRAQDADRLKSSFLANMSHELRTPLNAIIGFSQMISGEILGPVGVDRYAEYASDIRTAGEHLLALINDVLDVSRLSAGGRDLDLEEIDLVAELRASADLLAQQAESRGQTLEVDLPAGVLTVQADRRAIRQVALNLLANAVKFTPSGGRVRLTARLTPATVGFTVSDTGIGIPVDQQEVVFKPFRQVSDVLVRDQGGTGLGLPISRALMELHGGGVSLESRVGEGTTVRAWLPRHPAADGRGDGTA